MTTTTTTTVLHVSAFFHKAIIRNYSVIGGWSTVKLMELKLWATHCTFVPNYFFNKEDPENCYKLQAPQTWIHLSIKYDFCV